MKKPLLFLLIITFLLYVGVILAQCPTNNIWALASEGDNSLSNINYNDIILEQNRPNPFSGNSEISYYIPKIYGGSAKLIISDEHGVIVYQQFDICSGKPFQMTISSKDLQTGVYIYGIEINGRLVKSNKMMVIK